MILDNFGSSPVLFSSSFSDSCNNNNQNYGWVAEASKNGSLYVSGIGSGGLLGTVSSIPVDANGFVASPAVGSYTHSINCKPNGIVVETWGRVYLASGNGSGGKAYREEQGGYSSPSMSTAWTSSVSYPTAIYSAPTLIGGNEQQVGKTALLLLGSDDHNLYALNGDTGVILWSFATGGAIDSSPAISNGRVYFGSSDGYLRCLSINGP